MNPSWVRDVDLTQNRFNRWLVALLLVFLNGVTAKENPLSILAKQHKRLLGTSSGTVRKSSVNRSGLSHQWEVNPALSSFGSFGEAVCNVPLLRGKKDKTL